MQLYVGMSNDFVSDAIQNRIAEKLREAYFYHFRRNAPQSEIGSWRNSLRALSQVLQLARLNDHGVILEFQLPLTSRRLDCLICGKNTSNDDNAVVVELKQWERCSESDCDQLVRTFLGGCERDTLHPSVQVMQYHLYLQDAHTAFYDDPSPVSLSSCAYLHNYFTTTNDHLFADRFSSVLQDHPAFTADDVDPLACFLSDRLRGGDGHTVLQRIATSRYRPSKKLMDHVGGVIKGRPEYVLLDEQLEVYQRVMGAARRGFDGRHKSVMIIRGGPGTGKSVIALNLMADLLLSGRNAQYATGSKAFTETLRSVVGSRAEVQFKYFNSYMTADRNEVDVLICDESHRLRKTSNNRFTARDKQSDRLQIEELLDVSKVAVFFIDDRQSVRPDEIGSAQFIRDIAEKKGCRIEDDLVLETQFRCAGSEEFIGWVNNTLGLERTANILWDPKDAFEFRVVDTPEALDREIRSRAAEGHSARLGSV